MRRPLIIGVFLMAGVVAAGAAAISTEGPRFSPSRQWAFVELVRQTQVNGVLLPAGEYLIVHDYEQESRGEPCTSLYADSRTSEGPEQEAAVSFHCVTHESPKSDRMTLVTETIPGNTGGCTYGWSWMMDKLTAFQFPGDSVSHTVPESH